MVNPGQTTVKTSLSLHDRLSHSSSLTRWTSLGQVKRHGKETDFTFNLRLDPGETVVLRTFSHRDSEGPMWSGPEPSSENRTIGGDWTIHFDDQAPISTSLLFLQSLPRRPAQHRPNTARYELVFGFDLTEKAILDLGEVAYTAKVRLNGLIWEPATPHPIGFTWGTPQERKQPARSHGHQLGEPEAPCRPHRPRHVSSPAPPDFPGDFQVANPEASATVRPCFACFGAGPHPDCDCDSTKIVTIGDSLTDGYDEVSKLAEVPLLNFLRRARCIPNQIFRTPTGTHAPSIGPSYSASSVR